MVEPQYVEGVSYLATIRLLDGGRGTQIFDPTLEMVEHVVSFGAFDHDSVPMIPYACNFFG